MQIGIVGLLFLTSAFFAVQQEAWAQNGDMVEVEQKQINTIIALGDLRAANSPLLQGGQGVIISEVGPGGQGASVGLMVHDVIVSYASTPVSSDAQFLSTVRTIFNSGQTTPMSVIRDGKLLTFSVKAGPLSVRIVDVNDQQIQSMQRVKALIEQQVLPKSAAMAVLQKEESTPLGWEAQKDSERLIALIKQERQSGKRPQGASAEQRAEAIMAQLQMSATSPRASTTKRVVEPARVELPREVISKASYKKSKFQQLPVYYKDKNGNKTLAGHYTGMVAKGIANGWGRLKLNNGVTIVSRFYAGTPRTLTRVGFGNGDKSYLAFAEGWSFCNRKGNYIVYDKKDYGVLMNCSRENWSHGTAHGVSYTKDLVALGDHPTGFFTDMILKGAFKPWDFAAVRDERNNGVPWRYAMYSPKTKTVDIEFSNRSKLRRYDRSFRDGRSWSGERNVSFKYGGSYVCYECGDKATRYGVTSVSPLGFTVETLGGKWEAEKIPGATVHRFRMNYADFSGLNPEPYIVDYDDGGHFQAEAINSVPEGFGYEYHLDGTEVWGQYHDGLLHGAALIREPDGSRQHANYKNGKLDGQVIHTKTAAPLRPAISAMPSPFLDAPFDHVAQLADQYDGLLASSKREAKKFGKKIVKERLLAGLPVNESFLRQERTLLAPGWQENFKQPNRLMTQKKINAVNSDLNRQDPLFKEYAAIYEGHNNKWPSELKMSPQSSFKIASWKEGVKTREEVISHWSRCTFKRQKARYVPEDQQNSISWADNIGKLKIMNERWFVPESICRAGIPDGKGVAISATGRWIITDAVFKNGLLLSGNRQSFSSSNVGYAGAIKHASPDGWGYARNVGPVGKLTYYRGGYKNGRFDGRGHYFRAAQSIIGTFANGSVNGPASILKAGSLENVAYENRIKVGPMTKVLTLKFSEETQLYTEPYFATATGAYNAKGNLDGPYKRVRDDGVVLFDGTMNDGLANGILTSVDELPKTYVITNADKKGKPISELYDPTILTQAAFHTTRTTFRNGGAVRMTDTADDGTVLYDGTAMALYKGPSNFDYLTVKRLKGRCYYNGRYEGCEYLSERYEKPKRIDNTGTQRRASVGREAEQVSRDLKASIAQSKFYEERSKQRIKEAGERESRRAKVRARERAADKERARQADLDLVARVYGGGDTGDISSSGSSRLYDPLNLNNPNTKAINSQVQRTVNNYEKSQQKKKNDYNAELARRNAKIEAEKRRKRNSKRSAATSSFSSWDCDRRWRADKCGDRHTVHTINTLDPAYAGGGAANSGNSGGGENGDGSNAGGSQTGSNTNNGNSNSNSNSASGPKMGPLIGEALAICRPKKTDPDLWWCDGPTQRLILADDPLSVQLNAVGCGSATPSSQRLALDDRHFVFFCKYGLQKSDRNIAAIHSLPGHILAKRKSYQCDKFNISKCTTLASP